jgi:WD40 repeat protein
MNATATLPLTPGANAGQHANPFPGLRPFREDEEYLFFGRENQVNAMVDKLAATRFLAVVGTSGSGKSSLVNCGLRPALHGGLMVRAGTAWRMAQFRPGSEPIRAMARALARDGVLFRNYQGGGLTLDEIVDTTLRMSKLGLIDIYEQANLGEGVNLLVVVDQFEELFRYQQLGVGQDENAYGVNEAATAFVNLLLEAKAHPTYPIFIVLTMRSDFLGDCTQFSGLAEAINAGQYLVPRMTRDERRAAIVGPVGVAGAKISPVLLTRLINDVGDNPDQLSILQHALNRTWARWEAGGGETGPLALEHYEAIGTMAHALDQHAERAFAELVTPRQRQICEKLFKALTDKATDPRGVRRPTTLATLCALAEATAAEVTDVIDVFRKPSRSFLMPPAGETLEAETVIDISHESLMRVWQRLNTWADEEAQSAQTYRRLAETAARHAAGKASLWRDPDLQLALDWRNQILPNQTWASRYGSGFDEACAFLRASEAARAAELEQEHQRAEAARMAKERELEQEKALGEARRQRARIRWVAGGAMVCIAFAVVAIMMWLNARKAATEATEAEIRARVAEAKATRLQEDAEAKRVAAQSILFADPSVYVPLDTAALLAIAGYQLQPSIEARRGLLAPMGRLAQVRKILASPTAPNSVVFAPDGKTAVAAGDNGTLIEWDLETGRQLRKLEGHPDVRAWALTFSPDGAMIVSGDVSGAVMFWDAASGKPLSGPEKDHAKWVNSIVFSPDGKTMVSASDDRTLVFWNPATRKPDGERLRPEQGSVNAVAFSPDGKRLATAHGNGSLVLWNANDRQKLDHLEKIPRADGEEKANGAFAVAFSPSRSREQMVSGHGDGTVVFWERDGDGKFRAEATRRGGHRDWIYSLAFNHDGSKLVSASKDGTIVVWDPESHKRVGQVLRAHKNEVRSVAFSHDGQFVSASYDKSLILWSVDQPITIGHYVDAHQKAVRSLAFRPDGKTVVSGSADGALKIWDAETHKQVATDGTGGADEVLSAAFSPDGKLIASGRKSGALKLSDGATLTPVLRESPVVAHKGGTLAVAFSFDGRTLVSAGEDEKLRLWNLATLQPRPDELAFGHGGSVRAIALNTDQTDRMSVASAGDDLIVRFWASPALRRIAETARKHDRKVNAVAYDPSGRILASASDDGTVMLWEVGTGRPLGEPLRGHRGASQSDGVKSLSFSRDGKMLASGATDRTLILWDVETRVPLEPLRGHSAEVLVVAFSPNGRTLVSGDSQGALYFWDMDPESWQRKLCAKLTRNLSQSEWETYVGKNVSYREQCPGLPKSGP